MAERDDLSGRIIARCKMAKNTECPTSVDLYRELDHAVAAACRELLPSGKCADLQVAQCLEKQLHELAKLGKGGKPNWDLRETAVLYSSFYQLGHVRLARAVAWRVIAAWEESAPSGTPLHIVDFGAGTLVLPIAFEMLHALGRLPVPVVAHVVEQGEAMWRHGLRILELMITNLGFKSCDLRFKLTTPGGRSWPERTDALVLMHAFYEDGTGRDNWIRRHVSDWQPNLVVLTFNKSARLHITEFEKHCLNDFGQMLEIETTNPPLGDLAGMPQTQEYRNEIWVSGEEHFSVPSTKQKLTKQAPHWPSNPVIREYRRRE